MFLRNWYKELALSLQDTDNGGTIYYSEGLQVVDTIGTTLSTTEYTNMRHRLIFYNYSNYYVPSVYYVRKSLAKTDYGGVVFGTGSTPPTLDDYKLSGTLITAIDASVSVTKSYENGKVRYKCVYTITNNDTQPVTINEVALKCVTGANNHVILLERTVLDAPVTIGAGEIGMVEYNIYIDTTMSPTA